MTSKTLSEGILRAIAILIGILLLLYFLYQISSVIAYIAIAGVVSLIGRPIVMFLRRKLKFNDTIAVIVTMLLLIGIVVGIVALFIPLIVQQGQNLSLLNIVRGTLIYAFNTSKNIEQYGHIFEKYCLVNLRI